MVKIWYSSGNMFIDHTRSAVTEEPISSDQIPPKKSTKKLILIISGGLLVVLLLAAGWWWYQSNNSQPEVTDQPVEETPIVVLPINDEPNNNQQNNNNGDGDFKAETLAFGSFYKSYVEPFEVKIATVDLPLNVKSQVSNYYAVARKINLDAAIPNLNKNGFAIIDNPFTKETDDFFGVYNRLKNAGVPMLITSDFLLYYYQNSLKHIYKEIEASYFYDNLWRVNQQLYKAANSRYQDRQRRLGSTTDFLLEAERLEASYFATSLALLSPKPAQINSKEDLSDTSKFTASEAAGYEFTVPSYLEESVQKELKLIQEARQTVKSPLLLYQKNYSDFKIPDEYLKNAKLNNFYLASRWQSTLFPINFKNSDCPGCLLDKDDWTINQMTAYLISQDLSADQSIKNEWAKVYKVMSFFSGLRSGLTYIHYQAVRDELFPEKNEEEIFAKDGFENLITLQTKLQSIEFKESEGGYNYGNSSERPFLGMRLLQTGYWPDQYIYNNLTYDVVGPHTVPKDSEKKLKNYFTSCYNDKSNALYRCRGIGFDILGTVTSTTPVASFIKDNLNYRRYAEQRDVLQKKFLNYNQGEWYVNNFWSTLSILKSFINEKISGLAYSSTEAWKDRQVVASLVGLSSLQIPADIWEVNRGKGEKNLETSSGGENFHYIEPQIGLNDELVANSSMLFAALRELGVVQDSDINFKDLIDKLKKIREITRQELRGEQLSDSEHQFILDLVNQYSVVKTGSRSYTVNFQNTVENKTTSLKETVGPIKLMVVVYQEKDQKVLVVGPILNYSEK